MRLSRCIGVVALGGAAMQVAAGCGGSDSKPESFASISSSISSPTGTVSTTSAKDIGDEYEKVSKNSFAGGMREDTEKAASGSGDMACPSGGSVSVSGSGNQSSGAANISYDNCCYAAGCCFDGSGKLYYSSSQTATYTYCMAFDVSYDCAGESLSLDYQGCLSATGWVFVVPVGGKTYAVSGTRAAGSGTLEIRGANGTWTCSYSSGTGHCSDGASGTFDF
jgi:hypothetical protein